MDCVSESGLIYTARICEMILQKEKINAPWPSASDWLTCLAHNSTFYDPPWNGNFKPLRIYIYFLNLMKHV